jgi:hypothetical protein
MHAWTHAKTINEVVSPVFLGVRFAIAALGGRRGDGRSGPAQDGAKVKTGSDKLSASSFVSLKADSPVGCLGWTVCSPSKATQKQSSGSEQHVGHGAEFDSSISRRVTKRRACLRAPIVTRGLSLHVP